jgi:hypothetical protein
MAATPYTGIVTFKGKSGANYVLPISGSDVALAFVTFSKSNQTFWNPPELVWLTDIALSASGVDTTRLELWANGADINVSFLDGMILKSIPLPRLTTTYPIAPGTMVQFKQQAS